MIAENINGDKWKQTTVKKDNFKKNAPQKKGGKRGR